MQKLVTTAAVALATLLVATAVAQAGSDAGAKPQRVEKIVIRHADPGDAKTLPDPSQIPGDHLKIDDLDTLTAGESRTYTSEGGKEVTVTRLEGDAERYTLEVGDRTIPIGGGAEAALDLPGGAGEQKRIVIRHETKTDASGQVIEENEETTGGPEADLLVATDGPPPLVVEVTSQRDGKVMKQVIVLREKEETKQR